VDIGIIGTGSMGTGLARLVRAAGHDVLLGSRDPDRARALATTMDARGGSYADAVAFGEAVILAVPWWSIDLVLPALGPVEGRVLIDCTNPVVDDEGSLQRLGPGSAAEEIAAHLPNATVVKCFNHIVADVIHLERGSTVPRIVAFLCGDDARAKELVIRIASDIGFEPIDVGPLSAARMLEPVAALMLRLTSAGVVPSASALALVPGRAGSS